MRSQIPTASKNGNNRGMQLALLNLAGEELRAWLQARGQPAMRARQIRHWLVAGGAESFDQMTDLPRDLRAALAEEFVLLGTRVTRHLVAADGTHKLLLRLQDDRL